MYNDLSIEAFQCSTHQSSTHYYNSLFKENKRLSKHEDTLLLKEKLQTG